jgi:uncharacterized protein (TIGR00255 family)
MQEIRSMTAYGQAEASYKNWLIKVEISAVNGKYADIKFRTPKGWQQKEQEWRKLLMKQVGRGTVQVNMNLDQIAGLDEKPKGLLNTNLFNNYVSQIRSVTQPHELDASSLLPFVIQQPGVLLGMDETEIEEVLKHINTCIANAFKQFDKNRLAEGSATAAQLKGNIEKIESLALRINSIEEQRLEALKEKMESKSKEWSKKLELDEGRIEQELLIYLDKWDITEEKTRLRQHCKYFNESLEHNSSGKKIAFIAQELGREITTLGNKAHFFELQKLTVEMKEELEKIKEQAFNLL